MVFCTPVLPLLPLDNDTSINGNLTLNGDEVGKIESIKFRDGTQCTLEDENEEHPLPLRGMCIAGQCQVIIDDLRCIVTLHENIPLCRNSVAITNCTRQLSRMNALFAMEIEVPVRKITKCSNTNGKIRFQQVLT